MVSDNLDLTAEQLKRQRNNEAGARYRERNREKFNQRMRDWREANRDKDREHKREHRNRKIANGTPEEVAAMRAAESAKTKRNQDRCRDEVYGAYGGYKCNCCNETEQMFLSIDHVNNDGAEHRKKIGKRLYRWIKRYKYPKTFRLLCYNCNLGRDKCPDKICPHEKTRNYTFENGAGI